MEKFELLGVALAKNRIAKMHRKLVAAWELMFENESEIAEICKDDLREIIDWLKTEHSIKSNVLDEHLTLQERMKLEMKIDL